MKCAVYTININNNDTLKPVSHPNPDYDYICFTDNMGLKDNVWKFKEVTTNLPPHLKARDIIINSHKYLPEYDYTLSLGGQIQINTDINIVDVLQPNFDIGARKHPLRKCAYAEAIVTVNCGKADESQAIQQIDFYTKEGMPKGFGLWETAFLFRKMSDNMAEFEKMWWQQVNTYTHRDQISLPYVIWKNSNINMITLPEYWMSSILRTPFTVFSHRY